MMTDDRTTRNDPAGGGQRAKHILAHHPHHAHTHTYIPKEKKMKFTLAIIHKYNILQKLI